MAITEGQRVCAACGEGFYLTNGTKSATYCANCRALSSKERAAVKKAREEAMGAALAAATGKSRSKNIFSTKGKNLRQIDAECRLFGMSYGQYTAACREGTIEQILKLKGFNNPKAMLKKLEANQWKQ